MESKFDRFLNRQIVQFSNDELAQLDSLKLKYQNQLFDEFQTYSEHYDLETSTHVTSNAKIDSLEKLKNEVLEDRSFAKPFFKILSLNGANVVFDNDKFIEFAISYSILNDDSEQTAWLQLLDIWKVHLLNLLILDWEERSVELSSNHKPHDPIFFDKPSEDFFWRCVNNYPKKKTKVYLSSLYQFMLFETGRNRVFKLSVTATKYDFAKYLVSNDLLNKVDEATKKTGLPHIDFSNKTHNDLLKSIESYL